MAGAPRTERDPSSGRVASPVVRGGAGGGPALKAPGAADPPGAPGFCAGFSMCAGGVGRGVESGGDRPGATRPSVGVGPVPGCPDGAAPLGGAKLLESGAPATPSAREGPKPDAVGGDDGVDPVSGEDGAPAAGPEAWPEAWPETGPEAWPDQAADAPAPGEGGLDADASAMSCENTYRAAGAPPLVVGEAGGRPDGPAALVGGDCGRPRAAAAPASGRVLCGPAPLSGPVAPVLETCGGGAAALNRSVGCGPPLDHEAEGGGAAGFVGAGPGESDRDGGESEGVWGVAGCGRPAPSVAGPSAARPVGGDDEGACDGAKAEVGAGPRSVAAGPEDNRSRPTAPVDQWGASV